MDIFSLKNWFLEEKRDLPWRKDPSPYAVWISEVMLQQTQAAVVIPYYMRWMERFPTLESVAQASSLELIKMWEGLGYYARIRNFHKAAQALTASGKEVPETREELEALPGLGPYTVGAILSFAFHQKAAAVDGNVLRVMARHEGIEAPINRGATKKAVELRVAEILPCEEPWIVMEALIELGAQMCTKRSRCELCPIQNSCYAYREGKVLELPIKDRATPIQKLERHVSLIYFQDLLLVQCGASGKLMADLYEFPYSDTTKSPIEQLGLKVSCRGILDPISQSFTQFRVTLYPTCWEAEKADPVPGFSWMRLEEVCLLPFSSGHRKILEEWRKR